MKKSLIFLLTLSVLLSFGLTAYAGDDGKDDAGETPMVAQAEVQETTQDASTPRLMVTDFTVEGGSIAPNKKTKLAITFKNYSKQKDIKNIKLSVSEDSGDIKPVGTGNSYVEYIKANSYYKWTVELTASPTAQIGEHAITISSEYEDKYFGAYSGSDVIRVNVKQTVGMDYSGAQLPVKVYPDDTTTMDINIMNTGKSTIRNCKVEYDIDRLTSGGATFVGEIPAGSQATASANLRVGTELGEVAGKVIITYEDEFGKKYKKEAKVSTNIVEKPVQTVEEEEEQAKYPLWWVFLITGAVVGGGVGCAIPIAITKSKQRKEDELRL